MVRITKTMQAKHSETLSPYIRDFCSSACSTPLPLLPQHLSTFPSRWPFPRGDLYHWATLLNRFDVILERFCHTYKLDEGPQTENFGCQVLRSTSEEIGELGQKPHQDYDLEELGFGKEGDRQLIESILRFSRMLLQNCGNRSIYASSSHLNSLLSTTSASLLECTLLLGSELAQRYQAALKRMNLPPRHVSSALLANHYNINLDRVLQLALPFTKTVTLPTEPLQPTTPSVKGKEKANFQIPAGQKTTACTLYANDLASLAKGSSGIISSSPKALRNGVDNMSTETSWEQWGDVKVKYYPKTTPEADAATSTPRLANPASSGPPTTPTPIRTSSNLGPHGHRSNRQTASDETPSPVARSATFPTDDAAHSTCNIIEISSSQLRSTDVHKLLRENISGLSQELQYELLAKLRIASALTTSLETRRQMLSIRLLAITNLTYIHSENALLEGVLKQDSDEPRRLQLVYQLVEMVHPPADGDVAIPRKLQTLALSALDALSSHQSKFSDVCAALNTNVNHGVLLYVVRKAVAEMHHEDTGDKVTADDEWRDTLFSLLSNLSLNPRTSGDLVTAGLIPILVEVLKLHSSISERCHSKILTFLDNIMYNARDAFQTLVSAGGLDTVSDLIVFQVKAAAELAASGNGIRPEYRSATVDYRIPYFQQQTLKWLLKFIHHMMSAAGGFGGNFDRLLRNLIDSSQLLGALRQIISNATCFGSIVWTSAVSILNDFINNEPTSFAIIAEAGLSRAFLEAVTGTPIVIPQQPEKVQEGEQAANGVPATANIHIDHSSDDDGDDTSDDDATVPPRRPSLSMLQAPRDHPLAQGIMPTSETINIVPQAFGAICLNNAGMKMFQTSRALESFFEIFESPDHVKCMDTNKDLAANLGGTFDELVRHHPPLKTAIMNAILAMVARVGYLCKVKAEKQKIGSKLWTTDSSGKPVIADAQLVDAAGSHQGKDKALDNGGDVEMQDVGTELHEHTITDSSLSEDSNPNASMTPYITAVVTFLSAILANTPFRSEFCEMGGTEYVLDLVDSPCLPYDFADGIACHTLHGVVATLVEYRPYLAIPSLLKRAQSAADALAPFASHSRNESFFAPFVDADSRQHAEAQLVANGTSFAKAFVNLHSLVSTLRASFHPLTFNHRNASNSFNSLNISDYYVCLVQSLGFLLGRSLEEDIQLQKIIPGYWKNAPRIRDIGFGEPVADSILGAEPPSPGAEPSDLDASASNLPSRPRTGGLKAPPADPASGDPSKEVKVPTKAEQESPYFKNYQTIRYLLSKMSQTISPFFQTLGKALVLKRNSEGFQRQSHALIAKALAETVLQRLAPSLQAPPVEQYSYWIGMLQVLKDMLIDSSRVNERPIQIITIVLQAFKESGGFDGVNDILKTFTKEISSSSISLTEAEDKSTEEFLRSQLATAGTRKILSLYALIVSGKIVTESQQTVAMTTRSERDRSRPDHFSPPQFLVELRMAVLPVARSLWRSELIEKGSSEICEKLIEVIRTIANADSEANAVRRSDKIVPSVKQPRRTFKISQEHLAVLTDSFDADIANEALYRCNNNIASASEYCREAYDSGGSRYPVPEGEIAPSSDVTTSSRPRTSGSTRTATPDDQAMTLDSRQHLPTIPPPNAEDIAQSFDQVGQFDQGASASSSSAQQFAPEEAVDVETSRITVDDLNEERDVIKEDLIDKCLDVINAHGDVTFEVADLITTVVGKSSDPQAQRKTVATTLVVALMSFAGEDDLRTSGKKIAAYANLLALMLRDKTFFFPAAVSDLKENLSTLFSFVKLSPNHSSDESSPWIAHILLVIEMLLSEDARPQKTKWTAPKDETDNIEPPVVEVAEPIVSSDERLQLFDAILDILPRIGKDEALALAVLRILVILTRARPVAQAMGEKKNIQRLFVMAKQLAGASSARIQSPLMVILRHIIEDDETIKQIMRSEIKSYFDSSRQQRNVDVITYLRGLAHTAIRNPELFVETTNEMVKFSRWTYPSEGSSRSDPLVLKDTLGETLTKKLPGDPVSPTVQATEDLTIQDVKPSTEGRDSEMTDATKSIPAESKLPIVENPDGVIHFLLCELLNYKDVDDKDPSSTASNQADKPGTSGPSNDDTPMAGTASAPEQSSRNAKTSKSSTKQEFKAEDHPIFIYRCFILQCLTELLSSYNRTKIEFINFKRSAPPQAMTPSKPRSGVVNYLLFDLIPIGTLDHADTTVLRKKLVTSSWADSVLTALLSKTGENAIENKRQPYDTEDESDLLFVRKFVLENILKAYREVSSSTEPLDFKYSRMLALSDLMAHIMSGKENVGVSDTALASISQKQLKRIMFEKGFIAALTSSIADIDLNFPGAKRAVKYILRPLKTLSTTAVQLSELGLVSDNQGQNDEDEIESATSVSDLEDEREETPDLFRNSTLGMFEPGREEDSSSESEDDEEEMYEGEYDEEMDYEEEVGDDEDNISDEDEEIEGIGPIEGLSGNHGVDVEVIMDDDGDDEDDDEDSSGDDEDQDDSEDDDARVEIIDEIEDGENVDDEGDMDEWESDEDDDPGDVEDYEEQVADHEEHELHAIEAMDMGGQLGHFVRALGGEDAADMMERMEEQMEAEGIDQGEDDDDQLGPDYGEEGDEDEDEDEDDMDDEMLFEQGFTMDGPGAFGLRDEVEPPMVLHRRPRPGGFPPFPFFPGGPRDPLGGMSNQPLSSFTEEITDLGQSLAQLDRIINSVSGLRNRTNRHAVPEFRPAHRAHRPGGPPPRAGDDGTNPLLQRNSGPSRDGSSRPSTLESFFQAMGGLRDMRDFAEAIGGLRDMPDTAEIGFGGRPFGEDATAAILDEVIRSLPTIPGTIARNGQALQFHITTGPGHDFPRDLQAMFGMTRGPRFETRREAGEPGSAAFFSPQSTNARWLEEAKLLFGQSHLERAADISNAIQAVLVPPAIEADKIVKAAEAERLRKLEEAKKKAEEERRAQEAKEAEEKAAKEKQESEEREAAERAEAEAVAAQGPEPSGAEPWTRETEEMDGVETTEAPHTAEEEQPEEAPAADRPRVTTIIRGNPYDITDLGIDADFLAELPDDIREEVIMSAVAERRSQAAATGAQPSEIDQEFLDALPDDIRDEIIQQERQDRRRREREERSRQAAATNGGGPSAGDMDAASILATLPPALRNQVLMEQDEEMLALLPQDLAEQARAAQRDHPAHHGRPPPSFVRRSGGPPVPEVDIQRPSRRATIQMLDKAGIATLLRLMFILQQGSLRNTLNSVLQNICMNRHNRSELLSTMLHILQDGSFDMTAVERSFAHLSLRAKQPSDKGPKTPQPLKRGLTGVSTNSITPTNFEASPLMVVQQCLSSLVYLTQVNPHIPAFFLTEHEPAGGLKRSLSRKGKVKETKAARYPLNSLLSLLDRELIMESSSVMESLSTLLNMTTSPLQALQRKQKEAAEESRRIEAPPSATGAAATGESPETTFTSEQALRQQSEAARSQEPEAAPTALTADSGATSTQPPPENAENGERSVSTEGTPKEASNVTEKKQRPMVPPVIPDHNLQLVINIFVARECSSKTFRETLSTIKNFSAIPGAKAVFGRELISKAQALGEIILVDLQDLLPQIQRASSGTEIQGVALAKFSPGGSDQNKLLRVLTALDHLFDPKRDRKEGAGADPEGETSQLVEKQDLLSSLYENSTFGPMWEKLSECLRAIRQREHMLNVATILLPLIEALMVVCKNTTLKDTPISRSMIGKEMLLTSPPPESRMESLFFTFTEEHRKILNDLVRHTPKLMSGTFSLLVKNPKVLEFDNKRNYFNRSVHAKAPNGRQSFPPLQLSVRRDQVFHDSFKSLYFQTGDQMKYGKLSIRFHGEEGVDAGGVTREWFQVLSRQMFDPGYALFIPVSSDRTTFHPNQLSSINEEHLMFFKFIGRIIGKALYEGRVLDCHFSRAVYKRILGKPVSVKDMESLDLEYYKSLVWMLENDITDIITETFSVDNDKFGVVETIDFIPNGRNIAVTEENKHEYIRLMVEWKLTGSVQEQLDEFLKGFHDIIPAELISIFNEQELELLISGLPEIDVDDWKSNTEYHNYSASSPQIQWFWRAVRSFDKEERAKLLQFVTGTSKVPLNGFMELEGMNGFSRFNIHRDYGNKDRLPSSHTCFNQLDLPEYENYESLRQQVLTAITAGSEYFGFA